MIDDEVPLACCKITHPASRFRQRLFQTQYFFYIREFTILHGVNSASFFLFFLFKKKGTFMICLCFWRFIWIDDQRVTVCIFTELRLRSIFSQEKRWHMIEVMALFSFSPGVISRYAWNTSLDMGCPVSYDRQKDLFIESSCIFL